MLVLFQLTMGARHRLGVNSMSFFVTTISTHAPQMPMSVFRKLTCVSLSWGHLLSFMPYDCSVAICCNTACNFAVASIAVRKQRRVRHILHTSACNDLYKCCWQSGRPTLSLHAHALFRLQQWHRRLTVELKRLLLGLPPRTKTPLVMLHTQWQRHCPFQALTTLTLSDNSQ